MEQKGVLEALNRHNNGQFRPPVFTHLTPLLTPRMTPPASAYHHCLLIKSCLKHELPRWLSGKDSALSAGEVSSIPGPGRSSGEGNGNPLQYSCLENSMDRGAWWITSNAISGIIFLMTVA